MAVRASAVQFELQVSTLCKGICLRDNRYQITLDSMGDLGVGPGGLGAAKPVFLCLIKLILIAYFDDE